jgi:ribosomal protein S6E (S10)
MSYTARITSTSAAQGEPMTLGVEGAEANIDRILFNAPNRKKGRKRHRKHSRGRAGGIIKAK